jgi:hypothetical protein
MAFAFIDGSDLTGRVVSSVIIFFCTTVASFLAGRWWGRYRAHRQWQRKHFLGRIIVSLNNLSDGKLKIRTILERSLEEIFLNPVVVEKVQTASLKTTPDAPLIPFEPEDRWYMLNFVLNAVAERFCEGMVRYDAGQPVRPVTYVLFLTCEVLGDDRIRKVRAMMMQKELLENFPYTDSMPQLERELHRDRIVTLRRASEVYRKEPDYFLPIEIYV